MGYLPCQLWIISMIKSTPWNQWNCLESTIWSHPKDANQETMLVATLLALPYSWVEPTSSGPRSRGPIMSHAVPCGVSSCHVPICAKRLVWSWRWCLRTSKGIFQVGNTKESDVALRRLVKHFGEVINSMFTRHTASRDNYCWSMMPVLRPIAPTWFFPLKVSAAAETSNPQNSDRAWFKERPCPPKARISENCTWHIGEASLMEV